MYERIYDISVFAIGLVVGGWITYRYSLRLLLKQEFIKSASDFRDIFLDTKYSLWSNIGDESGKPWKTINIAEKDFPIHEKAYFRFRGFLSENDRTTFDDTWNEYICKPHKDDVFQDLFLDYLPIKDRPGLEDRTEEECKREALKRIDKLLKFAKH